MNRLRSDSIRKLTRIGKMSYGVIIPIDIIRKFNWRERQRLEVLERPGKTLLIRDFKFKR